MSSNRGQRSNRNQRQNSMNIYGNGYGNVQGDNAHVTNNFYTSPSQASTSQSSQPSGRGVAGCTAKIITILVTVPIFLGIMELAGRGIINEGVAVIAVFLLIPFMVIITFAVEGFIKRRFG